MDSKKSLGLVGVVAVAALVAAVWMVARPARGPIVPGADEAVAPVSAHGDVDSSASGEKIALQFYRDPSSVGDVTMTDVDGQRISSAGWKGKVVIVNFWATWCPPCRAEIPDLVALQEKYRDQLLIIGISDDEDPPAVVKKWAVEHKVNYPIVMSTPELRKVFAGVSALPTSFIVSRESRVVMRHVGMLTAARTEAETRHLAGLPVNASVEEVEKDRPAKLADALQVTSIPGIDLSKMTKEQRVAAITKLNDEPCTCGCNQTVARCRVDDPTCPVSLPRAKELIAAIK
jgi:thiol-disulfide isomerase/thioredoxin